VSGRHRRRWFCTGRLNAGSPLHLNPSRSGLAHEATGSAAMQASGLRCPSGIRRDGETVRDRMARLLQ